jgi:hypothetical protein
MADPEPGSRALWDAVRQALASAQQGPPLRSSPHALAATEAGWLPWDPEPAAGIHIDAVFRLEEPVAPGVLERSLVEIARRHEVLRTVVQGEGEQRRAVLLPAAAVRLPVVDLRALPHAIREDCAESLTAAEAHRCFRLDREPLAAFTLLLLDGGRSVFLATFLHAVFDGWSLSVFTRELSLLYETFAAGRPSPLPEPVLQFADFALWKGEWLLGPEAGDQIGHWLRVLTDPEPAFPPDEERDGVAPGPAVHCLRALPDSLMAAVRRLGSAEEATPFMVLLAAFQALLHRFTGREDLCLGTVAAGRTRREVAGLIGCFLNTLPLRTSLAGDPPFRELLARVRKTALDAFAHPDVPFEWVLAELGQEAGPLPWPLEIFFLYQNFPRAALRLGRGEAVPLETPTPVAPFALQIMMQSGADGILGQWQGHGDVFDRRQLALLAAQHEELLRAAVEEPGRRLSELPPEEGALDPAIAAILRRLL